MAHDHQAQRYFFRPENRVKKRADFLLAYNNGTVYRRRAIHAFVLPRETPNLPTRIGFTVTKKNGSAVERNRIRRRLRELVKRVDVVSMRPHSDYVLVGRRVALNRDFMTMLDDLRGALQRLERQAAKSQSSRPSVT